MKKLFSSPWFYGSFALLGLGGMGCQLWMFSQENAQGFLQPWHPGLIITLVLVLIGVVLALLSSPYIQPPRISLTLRAVGICLAAGLMAVAATVLLLEGSLLPGLTAAVATAASLYVLWARLTHREEHYWVYGIFALCFVVYLISRYMVWSTEPEIPRYAFKLLALICMMLSFYQMAAVHARTGRFLSYHFWRSMALVLGLTAIPGTDNPFLYLAATLWLLMSPAARPRRRETENKK